MLAVYYESIKIHLQNKKRVTYYIEYILEFQDCVIEITSFVSVLSAKNKTIGHSV
jgi:hypothetical protein